VLDAVPPWLGWPVVFHHSGKRYRNLASRFTAIARRALGAAVFSFHDLRHWFSVDYLRRGRGSIYDRQQALGHRSIKTTERYLARLTADEQRAAKSPDPPRWGSSARLSSGAAR